MNFEKCSQLFLKLNKINDIEKYIDELVELIKQIFYENNYFVKNSDNNELRTEFYQKLRQYIKQIYNSYAKGTNISDNVKFIGCGRTSLVFKIGDIVLKISKSNIKYNYNKIADYECTIPIISHSEFEVANNEHYVMQVTPYVDTNDLNDEDVYSAYYNIRKHGYIWNDPDMKNIGKIIEDITINNIKYKKGDIVIIDLEDMAYVGEVTPDIILTELCYDSYNSKAYACETRYIEESQNIK